MTDNNNDLLGIKEEFAQWCKPRRGKLNPETMTNIVWSELIQNNYSPYKAHKTYGRGEKHRSCSVQNNRIIEFRFCFRCQNLIKELRLLLRLILRKVIE